METVSTSAIDSLPITGSVVTVGNFDGVHRGHGLLIGEVVSAAKAQGLSSVIVTFEPHTRAVLFPDTTQQILSTLDEKAVLIGSYGADYLVSIPFTREFAAIPAEEFVQRYLIKQCKARQWIMGEGHTFGKNHGGNKNFSHHSKGKNDIYIVSASSMRINERVISSTEIRANIVKGRIDDAVAMLGHPYLIVSRRISGVKKGTQIGYPTINFENLPSNKVLPPPGIYAAEVEFGEHRWKGALYFGDCPTFGNRDRHFEFHCFEYNGIEPRQGENTCLWLHTKIRSDKAFTDAAKLRASIKDDIESIKIFFHRRRSNASNKREKAGTCSKVR